MERLLKISFIVSELNLVLIVSNFVVILQNAIFIKKLTGKKQLVFRFISCGMNKFLLWVFGTHLILKLKKKTYGIGI